MQSVMLVPFDFKIEAFGSDGPFRRHQMLGVGIEFNVDGLKEYTTVQVINVAR